MGMAVALALIVSYVESLIPFPVGIPGAKIGLTNIVILIVLYRYGFIEAGMVSILRIFLAGFMFGNLSMILYSLAGGGTSLLLMQLCRKTRQFSVLGVSTVGGVAHNMGQLVVALLVLEQGGLLYYMPFLIAVGTVTGVAIGVAVEQLLPHLPEERKIGEEKRNGE